MQYLYGLKGASPRRLVATFDSEPQLLAYVRWATLQRLPDGTHKFEQGSALSGSDRYEYDDVPPAVPVEVTHNPSPGML